MSIRRAPRPNTGWLLVRNDVARDVRLSPKARGILIYLLSFPDDWRFDHRTIARANGVGRDYVLGAMKELRTHGYLIQERRRGEKGQWVTDVVLFDTPQPSTGKPDPADPDPAEPDLYIGLSPEDCHGKDFNRSTWTTAPPTPSAAARGSQSAKAAEANRILLDVFEDGTHGDMETVMACLRGCHGAKNPAMWLRDMADKGQLDGFLGSQGLGDTCWKCSEAA